MVWFGIAYLAGLAIVLIIVDQAPIEDGVRFSDDIADFPHDRVAQTQMRDSTSTAAVPTP